jgi:hypothetical protein
MVERQPNPAAPNAPPRDRDGAFGKKDFWALSVGAVLVVLVYLVLCVGEAWRDAPPAAAPPSPPPPPQASLLRAVLVVGTVEVLPTKANGKRWDAGMNGLPDPCVLVVNRTQGSRHRTAKVDDTLKATFDVRTVAVREGDELYLRVDDVDVQFDDLVGEHRFRVTREMIEQGELALRFGQVKRLTLRFER